MRWGGGDRAASKGCRSQTDAEGAQTRKRRETCSYPRLQRKKGKNCERQKKNDKKKKEKKREASVRVSPSDSQKREKFTVFILS